MGAGHSSLLYPDLPRVAVGAIVFRERSVLLVQRGKAPAEGLWAIPGGSVEIGETLQEAAEREIREETGVIIRAREPAFAFDVIEKDENGRIRFHYVIIDLLADYVEGIPSASGDAVDAAWVDAAQLKQRKVSPKSLQLLRDRFGFIT
jgi:8-oxo-dGTP diphosphatase